jgi:hypothetical protein
VLCCNYRYSAPLSLPVAFPLPLRCFPCCAGFQVSGLLRERTKLQILQEAVIVASTLSFAGGTGFAGPLGDGRARLLLKWLDTVLHTGGGDAEQPCMGAGAEWMAVLTA